MFRAAVDEVPGKAWLHSDDGVLTYADGAGTDRACCVGVARGGCGRGDRVLVTARNTPEYLLTWFALMEIGAIQVPVNPLSTDAELDGFIAQVGPRLIVSDDERDRPVRRHRGRERSVRRAIQSDVAVMIPTSGTTGRSKLVMQTHLAYVMAGEGFPYWMQLTADDRLMTSLPLFHINAPAYSTLGSVAARASLVLLPAFSASGFLDAARRVRRHRVQLHRRHARDPDAPARARRRRRHPACASVTRARRPSGSATRRSRRASASRSCAATRCRRSPYGLIWRHGTRPFGTLGVRRANTRRSAT